MHTLSWFFDYISPFAYLQWKTWGKLPNNLDVHFYPVLFAGLLKHWGHKGPAEIPKKRDFTYRHIKWLAAKENIAICFPPVHPFNPLRPLRLSIALGNDIKVIDTIFNFIWQSGKNINDDKDWQELLCILHVDDAMIIEENLVKEQLKNNGNHALELGIFGVPSFIFNGEIFWGFDSTEMLVQQIQSKNL